MAKAIPGTQEVKIKTTFQHSVPLQNEPLFLATAMAVQKQPNEICAVIVNAWGKFSLKKKRLVHCTQSTQVFKKCGCLQMSISVPLYLKKKLVSTKENSNCSVTVRAGGGSLCTLMFTHQTTTDDMMRLLMQPHLKATS